MNDPDRFQRFAQFYPFYLREHSNATCRVLHYVGSLSGALIAIYALLSGHYALILAGVVIGYACAWVGHCFFEHNRPATFSYPLWSLMGDWVMLKDFLTGRLPGLHPALRTGVDTRDPAP